ncbi:MAG TPA: FtsK/SpoIIIE domain-containing protein, partial [Micromonospora sp.]
VTGDPVWRPGGQVTVGEALLELTTPEQPDAEVRPVPDSGTLAYNRPPRLRTPSRTVEFRMPVPPREPDRSPLLPIAGLSPLVLAVAAAVLLGNRAFLLIGVLSPVMLVVGGLVERRRRRRIHRRRSAEHQHRRERLLAEATRALWTERDDRRANAPDPAAALLFALGPRLRLWERRLSDDDFLLVRVGTADQPSAVVLHDPEEDEHRQRTPWTAPDAPVTVELTRCGVVGVAGARAVARWMVAQAAVLHSPADLRIVAVVGSGGEGDWGWLRWLPHTRGPAGPGSLVGSDTASVGRRIAELLALVAQRRAAGGTDGRAFPGPAVLVLLDGVRRLRDLPGVVGLLRDGPPVGVYVICLDDAERRLPGECRAVVVGDPLRAHRVLVQSAGQPALVGVRADEVSPAWCVAVARALAPVRDASPDEDDGLPGSCRLLDLLGLEPPTPAAVAARWRSRGRCTEALVGVSVDGPFTLDLRRDGPHGLVAGTTGAGKSELLQTLVTTLAATNRPDELVFVLVDYKGGSAFKECVDLPHTVGMVTDLDAYLVERALTSLGAELRRRERLLAGFDARDIEDYQRVPGRPALPRLVIVIDEFASLARELPDFISGLVNVAQRGRSLGIHMILATQRPSGVVSPEIRANTNLRIALRVTSGAESQDVIDATDAARIGPGTPGRAYARLGYSSLLPFQTARVAGARPGDGPAAEATPWVVPVDWAGLGRPLPPRPRPPATVSAVGHATDLSEAAGPGTDLSELVAAISAAAAGLGLGRQPSPWLPALPTSLTLADLPAPGPGAGPLPAVAYALADLPAEQAQRPVVVDLARFGHLHVVGAARSGRSQVLRTLAAALCAHSTADVHLYGIDCGNGALSALTALPHCGAVVGRGEVERLGRLLGRLAGELERRQALLSGGGYADLAEYRAAVPPEQRPAHLVVLVDRWEAFVQSYTDHEAGRLVDAVFGLLREGAAAGLHLVVAGDRSMLTSRLATTTDDRLMLRLNDRADYGAVGIPVRSVPEVMPPGRALRAVDGNSVQVALDTAESSGAAQAAALRALGAAATARDAHLPTAVRPFRVDGLPDRLSFSDAWRVVPEQRRCGGLWALVGVGGDELAAYGADLARSATFTVVGPPRSGRSNLLVTMATSVLLGGAVVVLFAPRLSPLRELAGREGVLGLFTGPDGCTVDELVQALDSASPETPKVVLVDDAELLLQAEVGTVLTRIARAGGGNGVALVVAGAPEPLAAGFSGWHVEARRNRYGALLSPRGIGDGDAVGVRVPNSLTRLPVSAGRAYLHLGDSRLVTVTVPKVSD